MTLRQRPSRETIRVTGNALIDRVKQLIHEGNVRHIVIKQDERTLIEFPLTIGVVGALLAPTLAVIGAVVALVTECTIEVERTEEAQQPRGRSITSERISIGTMSPGDQVPPGTAGAGENLCPDCGGSGRQAGQSCTTCAGRGHVMEAIGGA